MGAEPQTIRCRSRRPPRTRFVGASPLAPTTPCLSWWEYRCHRAMTASFSCPCRRPLFFDTFYVAPARLHWLPGDPLLAPAEFWVWAPAPEPSRSDHIPGSAALWCAIWALQLSKLASTGASVSLFVSAIVRPIVSPSRFRRRR
jgi:hypothetical protein